MGDLSGSVAGAQGHPAPMTELTSAAFGEPFTWGAAHAAYQVEGA